MPIQSKKRQRTIQEFGYKQKIEEDVAEMIAISNLSFNQIAKSSFIRQALITKYPGQTVPKQAKGVAEMLMKFYEYAEKDVKTQIAVHLTNEKKFSATLDEWTSVANYRYLNINLHYTKTGERKTEHLNLGLLEIKGICNAEALVQMVRIKFFSDVHY